MQEDLLYLGQMQMLLNNNNTVLTGLFILFTFFYNNYYYMQKFLNRSWFDYKNVVTIEGIRIKSDYKNTYTDLFSTRFKAIWSYIQGKKFKNVKSIKEIASFDYFYNKDDEKETIETNVYVVDQKNSFEIYKDIHCKINTYKEDRHESATKKTAEEIITIEIFSYVKTVNELQDFIDKIKLEYEITRTNYRKNKKFVYTLNNIDDNYCWAENEFISYKNFTNLFFQNKYELIDKINFFKENKNFYVNNGISYTLGIALSGPPGTGKTSIIKCIANYLNRHLIVIPLNKIKSSEDLYKVFYESTYSNENTPKSIKFENKIILLEDIDCMGEIVKRRKQEDSDSEEEILDSAKKIKKLIKENKSVSDKITLSDILNVIDGVIETPDRIIIITSNHYNKLDPALVRPGRIDYHLNLDFATPEVIKDIYYKYYKENINCVNFKNNLSAAQLINFAMVSKDHYLRNVLENNINSLCTISQ